MVIHDPQSNITLLSILCGEVWWWDSDEESQIIFHRNGTGLVSLNIPKDSRPSNGTYSLSPVVSSACS